MRKALLASVLCMGFLLLARGAAAQSAVAGIVRDATGAVLPGVTVEASSPALIEKVRATTTDTSGQYRIVDLRPGVYTVTFTLTGFASVVRPALCWKRTSRHPSMSSYGCQRSRRR